MRRILLIILIIVIILIVGVFVYKNLKKEIKHNIYMTEILQGKKIAMLIAFRDFRDEEYFIPKQILEEAGAEIKTASKERGTAIGADGGEAEVDFLIEEINPADFDAIVFIGGPGALKYLDNEKSYQLARETIKADKVLGAICIAPAILAKSGVLKGKKATVWSSVMDKSAVKILEENGAVFQKDSVVVDGKIITADGPGAAKEFAEALIELL